MTTDQGTWKEQLSSLPVITVAESPAILVMQQDDHVLGWVIALPGGDAWIIRTGAKGIIHSGSIRTLVRFWGRVFDCEVGRPMEIV
ncbi:hypothetical protein [Micromonospora sp. CA-111912]|uniref:hypothetical protein n=1 Tax=Micromonospora sp. CA-111912 TaxID=3239955 RepID=UPI003D8C4AEF